MTDPAPTREYTIPEWRISELETRIEKLGKRAGKLGLTPPTFVQTGFEMRPVYNPDGTRAETFDGKLVREKWIIVTVTEPVVALPGWSFLGTIEHTKEGNILRLVPEAGDEVDVKGFRDTGATRCDHCNYVRRRKDTYIIRNVESGDLMQVGSTCITDFLGCDRLASLTYKLELAGLCDDLDGEGGWGASRPSYFSITTVLRVAAAAIRTTGWVSATAARKSAEAGYDDKYPTSGIVAAVLTAWHPTTRKRLFEDYPEVMGALYGDKDAGDTATAEAALEWGRAIDPDTDNDYLHNLRVASACDEVSLRNVGLVTSLIAAYKRAEGRELERRERARLARDSDHVGNPGDKIGRKLSAKDRRAGKQALPAIQAVITDIRTFENEWSTYEARVLYTFVTDDGDRLKWWTTGHTWINPDEGENRRLEEGDRVEIVATIKDHDTYRGIKETVITRANLTLVEPVDEPEPEPAQPVDVEALKARYRDAQAVLLRHLEDDNSNLEELARPLDELRRQLQAAGVDVASLSPEQAPTGGEGAGGVSEGDTGEVRAVQADPEVEALKASMGVEGDVVIEPAGKPVSEWPSMLVFKYGLFYLEQLALGPVQPDDLMTRCMEHLECAKGTAKTKLNVLRGAKWAHRENRNAPLVLTDAGLRALNYARKNEDRPK